MSFWSAKVVSVCPLVISEWLVVEAPCLVSKQGILRKLLKNHAVNNMCTFWWHNFQWQSCSSQNLLGLNLLGLTGWLLLCYQSGMLWPAPISCASQLKLNPPSAPAVPVYCSQLISLGFWGLRNPKIMMSIYFWKTFPDLCLYLMWVCCRNQVIFYLSWQRQTQQKGNQEFGIWLRNYQKMYRRIQKHRIKKKNRKSNRMLSCYVFIGLAARTAKITT